MIPYASALPNKECLEMLDRYYDKWRFLLSPASVRSVSKKREHLLYNRGYAIDNGVYSDYVRNKKWDENSFLKLLDRFSEHCDWIVIPDSIGDWEATLSLFMIWVNKLFYYHRPLMLVAQDGAEKNNYREIKGITKNSSRIIEGGIGIFIGGSTEWKLSHSRKIAQICRENNSRCHIGRVNSSKRVQLCYSWGATSFDGSGMSRFRETSRVVSKEVAYQEKQPRLFF